MKLPEDATGAEPASPKSIPSILIVEDEGLTAMSLQEFLTRSGYLVPDPVASAEEAFEYLRKSPYPDLILMDILLDGGIDGIEALRQIRMSSAVPVIFLSSQNDDQTLARAGEADSSGFILKPYVDGEVLGVIRKTLQPAE